MSVGGEITGRCVFVVDDEPVANAFAAGVARSVGLEARQFESAESFLSTITPADRGCVILDLQLEGMHGLELQAALRQAGVWLPVIVVSGRGNVSSAVAAMKLNAFDFFEKPVDAGALGAAIQRAVDQDTRHAAERSEEESAKNRYKTLSPRERQVMAAVVEGLANKQIAARLELSEKTIEVHRGNVMRKMRVDSVAALVRAAMACERQRRLDLLNGTV